jgi:hypothetical protein
MERKDDTGKEIAENIAHGVAKGIALGITAALAFAVFIVLGGVVVQWLWNWLVPDIFGLRQLKFGEALGLLALCRILFGGFSLGGGHARSSHGGGRPWWKKRSVEGQA